MTNTRACLTNVTNASDRRTVLVQPMSLGGIGHPFLCTAPVAFGRPLYSRHWSVEQHRLREPQPSRARHRWLQYLYSVLTRRLSGSDLACEFIKTSKVKGCLLTYTVKLRWLTCAVTLAVMRRHLAAWPTTLTDIWDWATMRLGIWETCTYRNNRHCSCALSVLGRSQCELRH